MSMIRLTPDQLKQMVQNSIDYRQAQNAATGSKLDANANVSVKNVATEEVELVKDFLLQLNRTRVSAAIQELYGTRDAQQYLEDLGDHFIYTHDETSIKPYCTSISMYPFLLNGLKGLGGDTTAPKHLRTFVGGFINLLHAIASQFAGAITPSHCRAKNRVRSAWCAVMPGTCDASRQNASVLRKPVRNWLNGHRPHASWRNRGSSSIAACSAFSTAPRLSVSRVNWVASAASSIWRPGETPKCQAQSAMAKAMEIGESEPVTGAAAACTRRSRRWVGVSSTRGGEEWLLVLLAWGRFMIDGPRRARMLTACLLGEAYSIVKGRRHGAVDPGQERLGFTADRRARLARAGSGALDPTQDHTGRSS